MEEKCVEARNLTHPPAPISHRERGQRDVSSSPSIKDVTAQTGIHGRRALLLISEGLSYSPQYGVYRGVSRATAHVTAGVGSLVVTWGHVMPREVT